MRLGGTDNKIRPQERQTKSGLKRKKTGEKQATFIYEDGEEEEEEEE